MLLDCYLQGDRLYMTLNTSGGQLPAEPGGEDRGDGPGGDLDPPQETYILYTDGPREGRADWEGGRESGQTSRKT